MGNVRTTAAKADSYRSACSRIPGAFGLNRQMIARDKAHQLAFCAQKGNNANPMIKFFKQKLTRRIRASPDKVRVGTQRNGILQVPAFYETAPDITISRQSRNLAIHARHKNDAVMIGLDARQRVAQGFVLSN